MKRLFLLLLFIPFNVFGLEVKSENVIMYNLNDDKVIYEKNTDELIKIASMTKIATAIVGIENIDNLDEEVILTSDMFKDLIENNASIAGFKVGDIVTYKDLLYGTMLPSGADATQALGILVAGSEENYVELMNELAYDIGMSNTNFINTSGLDGENQYSTVSDVAILLKYALSNDVFYEIFTSFEYTATNGLKMSSSLKKYSNKFNLNIDFIDGGKTGFTYDAGYCLASISNHNGTDYLLVTATTDSSGNEPLNIYDADILYNYFFDNYDYKNVLINGEKIIDFTYDDEVISVYNDIDDELYLKNDAVIKKEYVGVEALSKDYTYNSKIGEYIIYIDDEVYKIIDVLMPIHINSFNWYFIIPVILLGGIIWKLKK